MSSHVSDIRKSLFAAFQQDHAELGRHLYDLRRCLTSDDCETARKLAKETLVSSGAHIAFEEHDFYPALKTKLDAAAVQCMYDEHERGLRFLEKLAMSEPDAPRTLADDLAEIDALDHHVADCGRLFSAMKNLTPHDLSKLFTRLEYWRRRAPNWSDVPYMAQSDGSDFGS